MVARVATFEGIDIEQAKSMMDEVEARVRPMVEALEGYQGYLDLAKADGRQLSITFFDSDENAQAAEPTFDEKMPKALSDLFESWSGRRVSVERYQVVSDSRV